MAYGYPYPSYGYFAPYRGCGWGGIWIAVVIVLFILLVIFGAWWWYASFY
ncbi:sporulation protein YjcZ [Neobacillus sp. OS1-32]|jgi:hypothetical protein|uniref:Sporulation protein YjcZ n=1 Tax=Neobacillus paridis TaxID=2803862 RepID=A0ABS1TJ10_9BACI|nr:MULTISPECIES: sporulation protein YjcZ [Neobacillus]MBL4951310.1 sporulation protein YjcZ [Neobacillus paridis]WML30626.1 sporulation protein YjcZ [Neobacillus sp. OS1-32]